MPVNPAIPTASDPDVRLLERLAGLERRVAELEKRTFGSIEIYGTRTDVVPGGVGIRARLGLDGSTPPVIVLERWSQAGVKTTATFS